jgi:hypothetical protein
MKETLNFLDWDGKTKKCGEESFLQEFKEKHKMDYLICLHCGVNVENGFCLSCKNNDTETKTQVDVPSFEIPIPEEKEFTVNLVGEE